MNCSNCNSPGFGVKKYDFFHREENHLEIELTISCEVCGQEEEGSFDLPSNEFTITKHGMKRGCP